MEQVRVQILFSEETKHGTFTDAIYFSIDEYNAVTQDEIDNLKSQRVANYVTAIDEAPAKPEPTKDQLEANKAELERQLDEVNQKIDEKE